MADPDDAVRRRRDEMLAPLVGPALRASKRLLQDEHNELLDSVRRTRGRVEASRILPDPEKQHVTWSAVVEPTIDQAYSVGRALTGHGGRPARAPRRLVAELAAALITPLRERLTAAIDAVVADGPYESQAELHAALGPVDQRGTANGEATTSKRSSRTSSPRRTRAERSTRHRPVRGCAGYPPKSDNAPTPTTTRWNRP